MPVSVSDLGHFEMIRVNRENISRIISGNFRPTGMRKPLTEDAVRHPFALFLPIKAYGPNIERLMGVVKPRTAEIIYRIEALDFRSSRSIYGILLTFSDAHRVARFRKGSRTVPFFASEAT